MQRRLTLAMLAVTSLAILLVGAGVLVLAQIGARQGARDEVVEQLEALDDIVTTSQSAQRVDTTLRRLGRAFNASDLQLVRIDERDGSVVVFEQQGPTQTSVVLSESQQAELEAGGPLLINSGRSVVGLLAVEFAPLLRTPDRADISGSTAILVRQDVATVSSRARTWFLVSATAVLLASALVANWLASRFIQPIKQIEETTARIAKGDLTARVDVHGHDELAELGNAVNIMTGELDRSRAVEQEFLMSVSHDLRTPLTAITGYAEALTDGATDDPVQAGSVIGANALRLNRLVDDLLDLARLSGRQFRFEISPTDCADVVRDTVAGHQPRAEQYGVVISAIIGPNAASPVYLDGQRLAQAIGNLIDNALKFAESTVEVSIEQTGTDAHLTVRDDGPGIPEADLPFVFERLYVTKLQPRRAENSSGLGLAIVAELVQGMGGTILASSGPNGGTTMTMRFPLAASAIRTAE